MYHIVYLPQKPFMMYRYDLSYALKTIKLNSI